MLSKRSLNRDISPPLYTKTKMLPQIPLRVAISLTCGSYIFGMLYNYMFRSLPNTDIRHEAWSGLLNNTNACSEAGNTCTCTLYEN